jgi:hypothetical protein
MSIHINRFVDRIKANESRSQKDFIMSMNEARDLHADITKLLLALQQVQESAPTPDSTTVVMEMDGGKF